MTLDAPAARGTDLAQVIAIRRAGILAQEFCRHVRFAEVAAVFETPLSFLMNPANHQRHEREFRGALRAYYAMPHNGRYIWGATAGMLKSLYDRLYGAGEKSGEQ